MHDWRLLNIVVDGQKATASVELLDRESRRREIRAVDLRRLSVDRLEPWGPSVSVDRLSGPTRDEQGFCRLEIHMQSGDMITLESRDFVMPVTGPSTPT